VTALVSDGFWRRLLATRMLLAAIIQSKERRRNKGTTHDTTRHDTQVAKAISSEKRLLLAGPPVSTCPEEKVRGGPCAVGVGWWTVGMYNTRLGNVPSAAAEIKRVCRLQIVQGISLISEERGVQHGYMSFSTQRHERTEKTERP